MSNPVYWKSIVNKDGAEWNIYQITKDSLGMNALRVMFPSGLADEDNFVLFSTSGIHGSYTTIEGVEALLRVGPDGESTAVTFQIIKPRVICYYYGNCEPKTKDDIEFLKKLRNSSWAVMRKIGKA